MSFSCGTLDGPTDPTVVWAAGEIDLAVAAEFGTEIERHLLPGAAVALDLARVTFMDSMGVHVLTRSACTADDVEADFLLVAVPEPVRQVLELSGLTSAFTTVADLGEAEAEIAGRRRGHAHRAV